MAAASGPVKLKDDPKFSKYFKMLKMHLPPPAVKQKMSAEGLDPSILDMDPEGLSPNQPPAAASGGGGAAPAAAAAPEEEMDMFAQIRAAKAKKAAAAAAGGGGGSGGGKSLSMKAAMKKVEKALDGPRGARAELSKMVYPEGDARFEVLVDGLQAVLDAYAQRQAAGARETAKERLEKILAAEKEYKERTSELSKRGDRIDKEIEKWGRRKDKAPEKEAMEKELEVKWAAANKEQNEKCLKLTRSYIPSDIKDLVGEALLQRTLLFCMHGHSAVS